MDKEEEKLVSEILDNDEFHYLIAVIDFSTVPADRNILFWDTPQSQLSDDSIKNQSYILHYTGHCKSEIMPSWKKYQKSLTDGVLNNIGFHVGNDVQIDLGALIGCRQEINSVIGLDSQISKEDGNIFIDLGKTLEGIFLSNQNHSGFAYYELPYRLNSSKLFLFCGVGFDEIKQSSKDLFTKFESRISGNLVSEIGIISQVMSRGRALSGSRLLTDIAKRCRSCEGVHRADISWEMPEEKENRAKHLGNDISSEPSFFLNALEEAFSELKWELVQIPSFEPFDIDNDCIDGKGVWTDDPATLIENADLIKFCEHAEHCNYHQNLIANLADELANDLRILENNSESLGETGLPLELGLQVNSQTDLTNHCEPQTKWIDGLQAHQLFQSFLNLTVEKWVICHLSASLSMTRIVLILMELITIIGRLGIKILSQVIEEVEGIKKLIIFRVLCDSNQLSQLENLFRQYVDNPDINVEISDIDRNHQKTSSN